MKNEILRTRRHVANRNARPARRQSGLSLIEMMIALVLGLIVVSAVINVYSGSTRSARFSEGLRTMQENGRHGIASLKRGIRLAGYSPGNPVAPFDFTNANENTMIVQMMQEIDCNGQSTAPNNGVAINTYVMDETLQRITCRGNSAAASDMPLIEGVEGFRALYGIDEDGDGFSERYVPFATTLNPLEVNSVRFSILVTSMTPIRSRSVAETHVLLDTEIASDDRTSRRVFTSTVMLRNRR